MKKLMIALSLTLFTANSAFAIVCKCKSTTPDAPYLDAACRIQERTESSGASNCQQVADRSYTHVKKVLFLTRKEQCFIADKPGVNVECVQQ